MPRAPRIEYGGACYHLMCRGDRRELVYRSDQDCHLFLDTLGETCERTGWVAHAYVLMGNHYHMLVETPEPNLVAGMKWFQGTFTQRINARYKQSGHLFQGRYKALVVDDRDGGYFLSVADYVHLNPARSVKARRTFDVLKDYPWSSYPAYLKRSLRPSWLSVDRVLGCLNLADDRSGRRRFQTYMQKRAEEARSGRGGMVRDQEWKGIRRGWCYGTAAFRKRLAGLLDVAVEGRKPASLGGPAKRAHDESEAGRLLTSAMRQLGLKRRDLERLPKGAPEKKVLAWWLKHQTVASNQWIAEEIQSGHPGNLAGFVREVLDKPDKETRMLVKTLKN